MSIDARLEPLKEYIERTKRILELSSPQVDGIDSAEDYRVRLQSSFREISGLAQANNETLERCLLPLLQDGAELSSKDVELLRAFGSMLIDTTSMENLDIPLIYRQAERVLEASEKTDDLRERVLALDGMVIAAYMMINLTARFYPENDDFTIYREAGLRAAYELLDYLEPQRFLALPDDECRTLTLVNARYMRCLFEWDDVEDKTDINRMDIQLLKNALALADDPFYREQMPDYDWDNHTLRTLQYMADITERANKRDFSAEQLEEVRAGIERLAALVRERPEFEENCPKSEQEYYLLQSAYLTGRIGKEEFRKGLFELMDLRNKEDFSVRSMFTSFVVPFEYIVTFDMEHLSEADQKTLASIYEFITSYAYRMPKTGVLSFMLTFIVMMLRNYVVVPGGMTLSEICLKLVAAMHPPTYVHTLNVADITSFLAEHLIDRQPELFIGEAGTTTAEEVRAKRAEILEFAYRAALLHDVGKLFIVETIITYNRDLIDTERKLLQVHPLIGASLLRMSPETEDYAEIALGHHCWFNDSAGYPAEFRMRDAAHKTLVAIVQVADCLDAGTDMIGRIYKAGKTTEEGLEDLRGGRGTHYAPFVVDLFDDPTVAADLHTLLTDGRDENYRETYRLLKTM